MSEEIRVLRELGAEFERVARRRTARARRRGWRPLALIVVLVLGGATGALAAAGVFQTGAPLEPGAPVVATVDNGLAIGSSARLLMTVPDPRGGLPWSVRVLRTTRGETCIQLGRRAFGTIGVLGQDGAFNDDGRFHRISENYENALSCGDADARGNAFLNLILENVPASGFEQGCRLPTPKLRGALRVLARQHPLLGRALTHPSSLELRTPLCPRSDLRDVFYGLLGPDAVSITYLTAGGRLATMRTAGEDGAYMIVLPHSPAATRCPPSSASCLLNQSQMIIGSGSMPNREIRTVTYRDHPQCRYAMNVPAGAQQQCPNVGHIAPRVKIPSPAQAHATVTVRKEPEKYGQPQITVSFASPIAINRAGSYYYFEIDNPATPPVPRGSGSVWPPGSSTSSMCSPHNASDFQTFTDYTRDQRVIDTQGLPPCPGTFHGSITLIINGDSQDHIPGGTGSTRRLVANFTIHEP